MTSSGTKSTRSKKAIYLSCFGRLGCILLILVFAAAAQEQPQSSGTQRKTPTFSVISTMVIVDVTVRDRNGDLVDNLTGEDFRIYEDKELQEIVTFSAENIPVGAVLAPAVPSRERDFTDPKPRPEIINLGLNPEQPVNREDLSGKRLIILYFDLSSLDTEYLVRSIDAAREFVLNQTGPQDLMAVATYDSALGLVQDLTNDQELLIAILENLSPVESGDTEEDLSDSEESEDVYVPDNVQFEIFNTDRRLSAIETLAKMYREFPERKSLIYFSSGVTTTGTENNAQIRSTVDNANRSNMSIYTVDSRGLVALPPGGDASQRSAGRGMFTGSAMMRQRSNFTGSQETLTTLSHDTGGEMFADSNDLGLAMKQAQEDTRIYYVIGYISSNPEEDGKYRKIEVEIMQPDLKVKHRPGYFAAKSFEQLNKEERDLQLQQAMDINKPFVDVPLILQADYFRNDDETTFVPISIELDGDGLLFEEKGSNRESKFEFVAQVADEEGKITGVARDSVQIRLPAEKADRIRDGGIFYSTGFQLKSGAYKLKFLVRDNKTGKLGGFEQPLEVPAFDLHSLDLSSIVLGNQLADIRDEEDKSVTREGTMRRFQRLLRYDPLVTGGRKVIPSIGNVFVPRQTVYVYFQVYGVSEDPDTRKPCVETDLILIRDNVKILETTPRYIQEWTQSGSGFPFGPGRGGSRPEGMVPGAKSRFPGMKPPPDMPGRPGVGDREGEVTVAISLPLRNLSKGNYTLQVHVRDDIADVNIFQRVPIVIH
ncbi:MAG: VWA domain-containing protein [Acidobacteria bacterium]|nr:VWA domain-containing protein [Acidobacteriota bacterium]